MQLFASPGTFGFGAVPAANPATSDFRSAAISALTVYTGDAVKAAKIFDEGVQSISDAAAAGVKPYVYTALGVGALGLIFGTWALIRTRRRS